MKNLLNVVWLVSILFYGCALTLKTTDFPSKEDFYNRFNNSMNNKEVMITLLSDSSKIIANSVIIENDSLDFVKKGQHEIVKLPLRNIKRVYELNKGNHMVTGFLIGTAFSFLLSYAIIATNESATNNEYHLPPFPASLGFGVSGGLIGLGIASLIDLTHIFQFNP